MLPFAANVVSVIRGEFDLAVGADYLASGGSNVPGIVLFNCFPLFHRTVIDDLLDRFEHTENGIAADCFKRRRERDLFKRGAKFKFARLN